MSSLLFRAFLCRSMNWLFLVRAYFYPLTFFLQDINIIRNGRWVSLKSLTLDPAFFLKFLTEISRPTNMCLKFPIRIYVDNSSEEPQEGPCKARNYMCQTIVYLKIELRGFQYINNLLIEFEKWNFSQCIWNRVLRDHLAIEIQPQC